MNYLIFSPPVKKVCPNTISGESENWSPFIGQVFFKKEKRIVYMCKATFPIQCLCQNICPDSILNELKWFHDISKRIL